MTSIPLKPFLKWLKIHKNFGDDKFKNEACM